MRLFGYKDAAGEYSREHMRFKILRKLRRGESSGRTDAGRGADAERFPWSQRSWRSWGRFRGVQELDGGALKQLKSEDSLAEETPARAKSAEIEKGAAGDSSRALNLLWGTPNGAKARSQLFCSLINIENFD